VFSAKKFGPKKEERIFVKNQTLFNLKFNLLNDVRAFKASVDRCANLCAFIFAHKNIFALDFAIDVDDCQG